MAAKFWLALFALLFISCDSMSDTTTRVSLTVSTPDPAWSLGFVKAVRHNDEVWVHSRLTRPAGVMAPQVISKARYHVTLDSPPLPVKHWVTGKTWAWDNDENVTFVQESSLPPAFKTSPEVPVVPTP